MAARRWRAVQRAVVAGALEHHPDQPLPRSDLAPRRAKPARLPTGGERKVGRLRAALRQAGWTPLRRAWRNAGRAKRRDRRRHSTTRPVSPPERRHRLAARLPSRLPPRRAAGARGAARAARLQIVAPPPCSPRRSFAYARWHRGAPPYAPWPRRVGSAPARGRPGARPRGARVQGLLTRLRHPAPRGIIARESVLLRLISAAPSRGGPCEPAPARRACRQELRAPTAALRARLTRHGRAAWRHRRDRLGTAWTVCLIGWTGSVLLPDGGARVPAASARRGSGSAGDRRRATRGAPRARRVARAALQDGRATAATLHADLATALALRAAHARSARRDARTAWMAGSTRSTSGAPSSSSSRMR